MYNNLIDDLKSKQIIDFKPDKVVNKSDEPIKIIRTKGDLIDDDKFVKVKIMGNQLELCYIKTVPTRLPIKKIDEDTYLVVGTNEIKKYKKSETRDQQVKSLKRTFKKLRELINTNFYGLPNEKFITLTYKKKQRDPEQVYKDFKDWIDKVRSKYGACDYINVVEPQASGSFHCHVLVKFYELPNNYIDYNEFRKLWKHGSFVNVRDLTECDNIGAYLSAYLSDVELDDKANKRIQKEHKKNGINKEYKIEKKLIKDDEGNEVEKSFIKGGRLCFYPKGMQLYRPSRGIKKPIVSVGKKEDLILDDYKLKRSNKMELMQDDKVVNTIHYESYVKKGHKKNLTNDGNHESKIS